MSDWIRPSWRTLRPSGPRHLAAVVTMAVIGCGGSGPSAPSPDPRGPQLSPAAEAYLTEALDLMEENSVRRLEIDWPSFREVTREEADGAQTATDTYDAIRFAVDRLGDGHSRFHEPGGAVAATRVESGLHLSAVSETGTDGVRAGRLSASVGYVAVPGFSGRTDAEMTRLATDLQQAIRDVDGLGVCSWIVDLRGNGGGNMWPMLAGVGPILGEGDAGAFVDPEGETEAFFYEGGHAGTRGDGGAVNVIASAEGEPYRTERDPESIAVLTSRGTLSSGEAIAISFREHPTAVSFGQATGGLSTGVERFALTDGAILALATTTMADRAGHLYGAEVPPDSIVEQAPSGDPVLARAHRAVASASSCGGANELPRASGADLTGSWTGVGNTGGSLRFELELTRADTTLEGSATLMLGGSAESCGVEGSRQGADVALAIDCPSGPVRFAGVATDGSSLLGVLRESLPDVGFSFERP